MKTNPALTGAQYGTVIGSSQLGGFVHAGGFAVTRDGPWIAGYLSNPPTAGGIHSTVGALQPNSAGGAEEGFLIRIRESANLRASVTGIFQSPGGNRQMQFTITASNDGPDVADDVLLSAATPAGLTLLSASINGVNCQSPLVTPPACNAGEIPSGAQTVAVVTYSPGSAVTPGSTVNFTASALSQVFDPNIANNTASTTVAAQ